MISASMTKQPAPSAESPADGLLTKPRSHLLLTSHRIAMLTALLIFLAALALLVVMAFEAGEDQAQLIDTTVREAFLSAQWTPLVWLANVLSFLGAWFVTWPLRLGVTIFLAVRRRGEAVLAWLLSIALYEPLVGLLKNVYERPRPPDPQVGVSGFSFPSGHAVVGAAVAIGLVIVLVPAGPRRRNLEVLAGLFAFFMAASRVYLDVHWLTDVVAGTALGAAVVIGVAATVHEVGDRIHRRRIRRDSAEAIGRLKGR